MFDIIQTQYGLIKINRQTGKTWLFQVDGRWVHIRYGKQGDN